MSTDSAIPTTVKHPVGSPTEPSPTSKPRDFFPTIGVVLALVGIIVICLICFCLLRELQRRKQKKAELINQITNIRRCDSIDGKKRKYKKKEILEPLTAFEEHQPTRTMDPIEEELMNSNDANGSWPEMGDIPYMDTSVENLADIK